MDTAPGFGRWPWPRNVWAKTLEFIAAGEPRAVIFDIMFFGNNEGDQELRQVTEAFPIFLMQFTFAIKVEKLLP